MKKLFALALALVMVLSLAACGGNDLQAAAREIEKITGETTTVDDVKEAMEQLEALSGEKVTAQDVVDFTRDMYELADGDWSDYEPEDKAWPFDDIPAWPVAEGLSYSEYSGKLAVFVTGGEDEMNAWLEQLRGAGFNGYYWSSQGEMEYYSDNHGIYLDDDRSSEGEFCLMISTGDMELGFPEEIQGLFPEYNGDGVLLFGGAEDFGEGEIGYMFTAVGETEAGGQRYLQALKDAGFQPKYEDSHYYGAGGYYNKTEGGKTIGYASEEYWYEFDDETGTGTADFSLTIPSN